MILLVLVEQEEEELAHQEHLPIRMVHLEQQTRAVAVAVQVVMLGSVTPPVWLSGPAHVRVEFAPLPAVEVTLF